MKACARLVIKRAGGFSEDVARALWEEGTAGIWEVSPREWRASFPAADRALMRRIGSLLPGMRAHWEPEDETDWAARFQASLRPIPAGEHFTILPAPDQENPWPERIPLRLTPGMAFGTGEHFTTSSCLRIMESIRPLPLALLDVGCGSGILAIAACLLGVPEVAGCDNDCEALRIAGENAAANRAEVTLEAGGPDIFSGSYDCVLANIQAEVLVDLMPVLCQRVRPGGTLMLSGILWAMLAGPSEAARANGFGLSEIRSDGRWASLKMAR